MDKNEDATTPDPTDIFAPLGKLASLKALTRFAELFDPDDWVRGLRHTERWECSLKDSYRAGELEHPIIDVAEYRKMKDSEERWVAHRALNGGEDLPLPLFTCMYEAAIRLVKFMDEACRTSMRLQYFVRQIVVAGHAGTADGLVSAIERLCGDESACRLLAGGFDGELVGVKVSLSREQIRGGDGTEMSALFAALADALEPK